MAVRIAGVRLLKCNNRLAVATVWALDVQAREVLRFGLTKGLRKIASYVSILVYWVTCIQQSHFDSLNLPITL